MAFSCAPVLTYFMYAPLVAQERPRKTPFFRRALTNFETVSKQLDNLPVSARAAIENALVAYAMTGKGDVKALKERAGFRMRIGRYRVLFAEDQTTVLAIYIRKRETTTYR